MHYPGTIKHIPTSSYVLILDPWHVSLLACGSISMGHCSACHSAVPLSRRRGGHRHDPVIAGIQVPSSVIKHGVLENGPFSSVMFLWKPPLSSGIFQPCLTRGYSLLIFWVPKPSDFCWEAKNLLVFSLQQCFFRFSKNLGVIPPRFFPVFSLELVAGQPLGAALGTGLIVDVHHLSSSKRTTKLQNVKVIWGVQHLNFWGR